MKTKDNYLALALSVLFAMCISFTVSGCGHNIVHVDRGIGLKLRIPTPDGGSLIDFAMGNIDSTTTVLRGNTTYNGVNTGGGSLLGTAGLTQQIQVSTGTQVNEGNIRKILIDPNCPPEAKVAFVQMLAAQKQPKVEPSSARTEQSAVSVGKDAPKAELPKSTLGALIDKAPEILDSSTKPIEATAKPVKAITEPTMSTIEKSIKDAMETIKSIVHNASWVLVVLGVTILLLAAYGIFRYVKYRLGQSKSKDTGVVSETKTEATSETAGQPDKHVESEPAKETNEETVQLSGGNVSPAVFTSETTTTITTPAEQPASTEQTEDPKPETSDK